MHGAVRKSYLNLILVSDFCLLENWRILLILGA